MSWLEWFTWSLLGIMIYQAGKNFLKTAFQVIREIRALGWRDWWWWFEVTMDGNEFSHKLTIWNYCEGSKSRREFVNNLEELVHDRGRAHRLSNKIDDMRRKV